MIFGGVDLEVISLNKNGTAVSFLDGTVADVKLDFDTLENLSRISREQYHLAGAVQHGASTLPADLFPKFPELETAEIHLATNFQNMIYDSKHFPSDFKEELYQHLRKAFADEKKPGMTDEQFIYKTRKKGFGDPFKSRFWDLPMETKTALRKELEGEFNFLFKNLNVQNTNNYVKDSVQPVAVPPNLEEEIQYA